MKKLSSYINERAELASAGAVIVNDLSNEYTYMVYDSNTDLITLLGFDDETDETDWNEDLIKKIMKLKFGESFVDRRSSSIFTRIDI